MTDQTIDATPDMTAAQQPIGSSFGHDSTARDVLDGVDLTGATALITGGYSGLGLEATRALAEAGAHVIVPARRPDAASEALEGVEGVEVDALDLADQGSVAAFAERFLATGRSLQLVINNAGIMACPLNRVGPGWEAQLATNHLGHFALINRLWPAIAGGGARVVSVSSAGHRLKRGRDSSLPDRPSAMRWEDLQWEQAYEKWAAYAQAKTANVLFAVELDRRGRDSGVRAFSLHPGGILTPLQRHLPIHEQIALGWRDVDGNPVPGLGFKTPEQGAATQVWAATSPQLNDRGGLYLEDCEVAEVSVDDAPGVRPYALDPGEAVRLWKVSAELTGVDAFASN